MIISGKNFFTALQPLFPTISPKNKGNILDAISWLSFGCDGNNSLFDIQEMSNLPIDDLIYSLNILQKNKLIL